MDIATFTRIVEHARTHEKHLGLPEGFLERLMDEDDWSFVIKLHASLEAAVTNVLTRCVDNYALEPVFRKLELSRAETGKMAFADAFGLTDHMEKRYIRALSELRNILVHDVSKVTFDFQTYVQSLDTQQRRKFVKAFCLGNEDGESESTLKSPKIVMWRSTICIIAMLQLRAKRQELVRENSALDGKMIELYHKTSDLDSKLSINTKEIGEIMVRLEGDELVKAVKQFFGK